MCEKYSSKPSKRSENNNIVGLSGRIIKKMQEYTPIETKIQSATSNK